MSRASEVDGGRHRRLLLLLCRGSGARRGRRSFAAADRASSGCLVRTVRVPDAPAGRLRGAGDCPICNMALERVRDGKQTEAIVAMHGAVDEVKRRVVAQVVELPPGSVAEGVVTAVIHKEALEGVRARGQGGLLLQRRAGEGNRGASDVRTADAMGFGRPSRRALSPKRRRGLDGDMGWLQLDAKPRELLVVPESSVLYSGEGAYVLAAPPGGHAFARRSDRGRQDPRFGLLSPTRPRSDSAASSCFRA